LIGIALAVGLLPLVPSGADLRYTLAWGVLAGFGVLAWLFGSMRRIEQDTPENLGWGVIFGVMVATPLVLVGGKTLSATVVRLFSVEAVDGATPLPTGVVLAYLVFVMPLAETLFFRGVMQERRPFWLVAVLATVWSLVLFAPILNLLAFPGVAILIGVALAVINLLYGYVRDRNGLAAAWLCQIIVNLIVLFVPFVMR
jgi:membrane protease YdiL (CAAX protease family)